MNPIKPVGIYLKVLMKNLISNNDREKAQLTVLSKYKQI